MQYVQTSEAPAAIGPYSQAVKAGEFVFTSGQIALLPSGELLDGSIQEQSTQVLKNLSAVLKEAGCTLDDVVKTTCFLSSMDDFTAMNEVYASFFKDHKPARSTVAVKTLPKNVLVEIEVIALNKVNL